MHEFNSIYKQFASDKNSTCFKTMLLQTICVDYAFTYVFEQWSVDNL